MTLKLVVSVDDAIIDADTMAKLLLLIMVCKCELTNATWSEIDFSEALWTIPRERMERRNPHLGFLSLQAQDIFIALQTFAGVSGFVLPSRYDSDVPMNATTPNQVLTLTYKAVQKGGKSLAQFGPHEQKGVRSVYNKAKYHEQRAAMLHGLGRYDRRMDWQKCALIFSEFKGNRCMLSHAIETSFNRCFLPTAGARFPA